MQVGERDVAVIGCGALGLTSAILLLRAGAKVTIYAQRPSARGAVGAGDRILDAGLPHSIDELSDA